MSYIDKKRKLRPSIFDRLMDNQPHIRNEVDTGQDHKHQELRQSVRRDLEHLLNTRYRIIEPAEEYTEVEHSILNYGLPDLATVNISDIEKRKDFTHRLEKILKMFEPRFKEVKVAYVENKDQKDRTLRFRIDAMLYADPTPEVIVFDSVLEPISRTVSLEEPRNG
ncbi:MAG: type VI secretion system baseplate subunit TssE [Gammaproteobacteria bacterium]|jgi:type VI secretion system protein ImpF|nr:type VI secretion system baseplate subunit TssE [Gammaproteobacteria bacterium]